MYFQDLSWWRRFFNVLIISIMPSLGCASTPVASPLSSFLDSDLPKQGISAHRGGQLGCPINTIGAFQRSICLGVHQLELDVRATVDDVIVVSHDDLAKGQDKALHISESTFQQLKELVLAPCQEETQPQHISSLEQALAIMPRNIWINVDIKNNNPHVGKLVAEIVAKTDRFDQVIFAAREEAVHPIRQVAENAGRKSWIANMNRGLLRSQYVEATIQSGAEFIQLVEVPYLPFIRGIPTEATITQLHNAGVRVNYSWLREEHENELKKNLEPLFDRGVDFVLVDHVEQAMQAVMDIGISPLVPLWDERSLSITGPPFHCPLSP